MDNVGLSTPRGSGTSGYVTRNKAFIRPRNQPAFDPNAPQKEHRPREADAGILEHERKREIESKVFDLRDKLEDEGVDEDEIDRRCDALRAKLNAKSTARPNNRRQNQNNRNLKTHQVHELANAKTQESDRMRRALRLGPRDRPQHGDRSAMGPPPPQQQQNAGSRRGGDSWRASDRDRSRSRSRSRSPIDERGRKEWRRRERSSSRSRSRSWSRRRSLTRSKSPVARRPASRSRSRSISRSRSRSRSRSVSDSRSRSRSQSARPARRAASRSVSRSRSPSASRDRSRSYSRSRSP